MKYLIALLAVAGIVVSTMALRVHYMDPGLAPPCAVTEKFDCGAVNHSRFAVFPPHTFDEDPKAMAYSDCHIWHRRLCRDRRGRADGALVAGV